jgi:enoyl-CoA hydratase
MYNTITLVHREGVSTLSLNRPPLNLVTMEMLEEVLAALDELERRDATRAVLFTGTGSRAFCAGADLNNEAEHTPEAGRAFRESGRRIVERIETFPKAVVAAVRGWCIGGGTGFAWAADIRLASTTVKFRAGDVYLGIIPTWSMGMVRLVHHIGRNRTLDLLLLGQDVDAAQALELGLVSRVIPEEHFLEEAFAVAERLSRGAPMAITAIKQAVHAQYWDGPDRAARIEELWTQRVLASHDAHEGMTAFLEKRQPRFTGR